MSFASERMSRGHISLTVALLGGVAFGLPSTSGCSKREDELRNCDVPAIFQSSCDGALCHGSHKPRAGLDLVSPGVDQRLFHVPATADCDERKLVVPGHPEQSVLYLKVSQDKPFCGERMPVGGELSSDELACLKQYIESAGTDTDGQVCETCGTILCIDFERDPLNCGACDSPCAEGMVCGGGQCVNPCTTEETLCGSSCVDIQTDENDCGSCGHRCAPGSSCDQGVCACDPSGEDPLGGAGASTVEGVVSFSADIAPLFAASCGGGDCHIGENSSAPLDLAADLAFENLVGVSAHDCGGRSLVVPSSPDQSYLVEKVMGGALCAGERMPAGEEPLPNSSLSTIVQWICAGAPDN